MRQTAERSPPTQVFQQQMQAQHIFQFWKAVEALTPQKLDKDNPDDLFRPAYKIAQGGNLPWRDTRHTDKPLKDDKVWLYTAQCGVYDATALSQQLEEKIGAHDDVVEERGRVNSRLFDISFNEQGIPLYQTFMLSLSAWAAGQILHHKDGVAALENNVPVDFSDLPLPGDTLPLVDSGFAGFDALTMRLMQWIADEASLLEANGNSPDIDWIQKLVALVVDKTLFPHSTLESEFVCLVKCIQVKAPKPAGEEPTPDNKDKEKRVDPVQDGLLNSFYISELRNLGHAWQQNDAGPGFVEYMRAVSEPDRERIDLRSPEGLRLAFQRLLPTQPPAGAWPSPYPLAFSQQLAVNEIWRRHADQAGIFAVNGPPGTGKTTLLRDVVAAVVTHRAGRLIRHEDEIFAGKNMLILGDDRYPYYPLHPAIKGSSIVVASANNGAVENISLELPGADAVPESVHRESDYFADLVSELIGKPGWGLLAARLGNKGNRNTFMKVFWWRKPEENKDTPLLPPDTFTPQRGEGLAYHLRLIKTGKRKPAISWDKAKLNFKQAQEREEAIRQQLIDYATLDQQIDEIHQRILEKRDARILSADQLTQAQEALAKIQVKKIEHQASYAEWSGQLEAAGKRLEQHGSHKPTFLDWISTWGRAHREWRERYHRLTQESDHLRAKMGVYQTERDALERKEKEAEKSVTDQTRQLQEIDRALSEMHLELISTQARSEEAKSALGDVWPDPHASDEVREKSAPWADGAWQKARQALFLAALDVHRAFIEHHPEPFISNINLVSNWLQGKNLSEEQAELALNSLTLVVPVISTTFASVPRMFKRIGREAIGWLLIDEAGQALPQQAAGAIWRAARTVVVGDPKQLEPVSGIAKVVEGALAQHYGVSACWWPGMVSAQILADHTMDLGTLLPDPDNGQVWVGCPLRVHRRCDDPMFTVSNAVAYDGLMVHGKKAVPLPLPESCWIDVEGKACEGNWIAEEGEAVRRLLSGLRDSHGVKPDNIFLVSPFKDCAQKLSQLASELGFDTQKTGTVHTTQGKEASIVIFVLGGNVQRPGAKSWAASRPNLLNVAVSRAKQRLYVIGNRAEWQKQRYFSTLANGLPAE